MEIGAALHVQTELEDPLIYLPLSTVMECPRGCTIFTYDQASTSLYLVIKGRVKVSRLAVRGQRTVVDIYQADDFFGESAFLHLPQRSEEAVAMEDTKLMTWTMPILMECIMRRPPLAVALLQVLTQRIVDFKERFESFNIDSLERRLGRYLCRASGRVGQVREDGVVVIGPFTHELLAQCIGTSREVVTYHMNRFRRQGFLNYSRKYILVNVEALRRWLDGTA
jgi:CRP/FNR family transcriptional regulator